jgi:hypothetical protein
MQEIFFKSKIINKYESLIIDLKPDNELINKYFKNDYLKFST